MTIDEAIAALTKARAEVGGAAPLRMADGAPVVRFEHCPFDVRALASRDYPFAIGIGKGEEWKRFLTPSDLAEVERPGPRSAAERSARDETIRQAQERAAATYG
jgi:hypothetical protein